MQTPPPSSSKYVLVKYFKTKDELDSDKPTLFEIRLVTEKFPDTTKGYQLQMTDPNGKIKGRTKPRKSGNVQCWLSLSNFSQTWTSAESPDGYFKIKLPPIHIPLV